MIFRRLDLFIMKLNVLAFKLIPDKRGVDKEISKDKAVLRALGFKESLPFRGNRVAAMVERANIEAPSAEEIRNGRL